MKSLSKIQEESIIQEDFFDSLKRVAAPIALSAVMATPATAVSHSNLKNTTNTPVAKEDSGITNWSDFARSYIQKHEGNIRHVYTDTNGFPTIGYGYKIDSHNHKKSLKDFKDAGITDTAARKLIAIADSGEYHPVHPKKKVPSMISTEQSDKLFDLSFKEHIDRVKQRVPDFDSMPNEVKVVLLDMEYNGFLGKAVKAQLAFNKKDYKAAIAEMKDSKTYRDVKTHSRMQENVDLLSKFTK